MLTLRVERSSFTTLKYLTTIIGAINSAFMKPTEGSERMPLHSRGGFTKLANGKETETSVSSPVLPLRNKLIALSPTQGTLEVQAAASFNLECRPLSSGLAVFLGQPWEELLLLLCLSSCSSLSLCSLRLQLCGSIS